MNKKNDNLEEIDINLLVGKFKIADVRYARLSKSLQIVYWILIPIYMLLTILDYVKNQDLMTIVGGFSFIAAFVIFALFFGKYHKAYGNVDYTLPTLKMLKNAVHRYKPFKWETTWAFFGVLLIDVGLTLNTSLHFSVMSVQVYFLGTMALSTVVGYIIWYIKHKPLRDRALGLIAEIEGE